MRLPKSKIITCATATIHTYTKAKDFVITAPSLVVQKKAISDCWESPAFLIDDDLEFSIDCSPGGWQLHDGPGDSNDDGDGNVSDEKVNEDDDINEDEDENDHDDGNGNASSDNDSNQDDDDDDDDHVNEDEDDDVSNYMSVSVILTAVDGQSKAVVDGRVLSGTISVEQQGKVCAKDSFHLVVSKMLSERNSKTLCTDKFVKASDLVQTQEMRFRIHVEMTGKYEVFHDNHYETLVKSLELAKECGDIELTLKSNESIIQREPLAKKRKLRSSNKKESELSPSIRTNSSMLRAASAVFDRMLSVNMLEAQQKSIAIVADSLEDVEDMIFFLFANRLKPDCNVLHLMELAHFYELENLFHRCKYALLFKGDLTVDNYLEAVLLFDKFEIPMNGGYKRLLQFGKKNINGLKENGDYEQFKHGLKMHLESTDIEADGGLQESLEETREQFL